MARLSWYQIGVKDVCQELQTTDYGLSTEEVEKRLVRYGPNKLAEE